MHAKFYSDNLKRRNHLGDVGIDGRRVLRRILKMVYG
jgi:hypothetical protein